MPVCASRTNQLRWRPLFNQRPYWPQKVQVDWLSDCGLPHSHCGHLTLFLTCLSLLLTMFQLQTLTESTCSTRDQVSHQKSSSNSGGEPWPHRPEDQRLNRDQGTPIPKRQTKKSTPIPIITPNPDAQVPRWQCKNADWNSVFWEIELNTETWSFYCFPLLPLEPLLLPTPTSGF